MMDEVDKALKADEGKPCKAQDEAEDKMRSNGARLIARRGWGSSVWLLGTELYRVAGGDVRMVGVFEPPKPSKGRAKKHTPSGMHE